MVRFSSRFFGRWVIILYNITKKIYQEIQNDLVIIDASSNKINGSQELWKKLRAKYSVLVPGLIAHIHVSGKASTLGREFDYTPELKQLKEVILSVLLVAELPEDIDEEITNDAKGLLEATLISNDKIINQLIQESIIYIRSPEGAKKQIAVEKIWDAFERLKTLKSENKKISLHEMLTQVSYGSERQFAELEVEFKKLTSIGNDFQIRHFEKGKIPIQNNSFREYLYFRILSLLSYCINELKVES